MKPAPDYCRLNLGRLAGIVLGAAAPDYLADGRGNGGAVFSGAVAQIPRRAASTDAWPNRGRSGGRKCATGSAKWATATTNNYGNHCSVAESTHNGQMVRFVSPPLRQNPQAHLPAAVNVTVDTDNPKNYVMDLSFLAQNIAQKRNNLMALACLSAKQTIVYGAVVNGCCF